MTTTTPSSKRIRFNRSQMAIIVETMERNPNMNKSQLSANYGTAQRSKDWLALSQKLNRNGGALKSAQKWQKCWSDYKNEVRKRYRGLYYNTRSYLTPLEERVGKLMGIQPSFRPSKRPGYWRGPQSMELEICNVESIQDIPVPTNEPEKSTEGLADSESSTPLTNTPITIKVEPVDEPKKLPKANESLPSDTVPLVSEHESLPSDTVPLVSAPIDIIPLVSKPSDTISVLAGPIDIVPLVSNTFDIIPLVSGPLDLVPLLTGPGNNITLVPKESLVTGLPSVSNINKANNDIIVFEKSSAKSLDKSKNATVKAPRSVSKCSQTVTEDISNINIIADAMKTLSRAVETMAENQKAQIENEERRTILLEKLINHFCS